MNKRFWAGGALIATATAIAAAAWAGSNRAAPAEAAAQPERKLDPAEEEILKNADAFVQAFNKGDAKALAQFWTEKGEFTDAGGHKMSGREAIEKAFRELFEEHKGIQLRIEVESMKFLTADVAIEEGISAVITPDGVPPNQVHYTNTHIKKDGKWLLESVKTTPYAPPTNYEHLKIFEGLIGTWEDTSESGETTRIAFEWTQNQNYLIADFTTTMKGVSISGGTSWIGWDPIEKTVRTWMFEANGGFGQGIWTKADGKWSSKSTAVLADGRKASLTNVVERVDANTIRWEIKDRTVDGKQLPDLKPATMKRIVEK